MDRIIDEESRKFLEEKFSELKNEVDVNVYYDSSNDELKDYIEFTKNFISELSEISSKIRVSLIEHKPGEKTKTGILIRTNPSLTIGESKGYKILFSGSPLGYEASQIVETIVMVSTGSHEIEDSLSKDLKSIAKPVNIKVFVTPSCPYCPGAAYLANRIAVASDGKVLSEVIEANENPEISMEWGVESVPTQIINDSEESRTIGLQNEHEFINLVLSYGK
ncbi:MAG: thioredoxin family protein [Brevinematales bacterium]|nr:thioredoxin family protein [Brevinematales bacterium]